MKTQPAGTLALRLAPLALLALLALLTTAVMADELPAQAQRIWAPTGDVIGAENHVTATFQAMDPYGDLAKTGEDWQLQEDTSGFGLFNWQTTRESGYQMGLRGAGGTGGGEGLTGHADLWGKRPGKFSYELSFRTYDRFSDRTSELRNGNFGLPPAPPALAVTPLLEWKRSDAQLRYRLSSGFALQGGMRSVCRDGAKASLLRGATGRAVPNLKGFDSYAAREVWIGLDYAAGDLAADLVGSFRRQDGDRALGTDHAYNDDRSSWRASLGVNWNATARTRVMGFGSVAKLENKGSEIWQTNAVTPTGETKANGGQLGLIQRLGTNVTLRLAANFQKTTAEAATALGTYPLQTVDRDRSRQDYRANVIYTGITGSRVEMGYRMRIANREQILVSGDFLENPKPIRAFTTDQDKTSQSLTLKWRHRFNRNALLKLQTGWSGLDREQTRDWDDPALKYWQEDYRREQLDWKLGLQTRPFRSLRLDVGHRLVDRDFQIQANDGAGTTYKANRGYANLNWNPRDWLTVYGLVSVGVETYEMGGGVTPDAGMGPVNYDGTTLRYVPGASLQLTTTLNAEAMYEGVRFEDKADTDGDLGVLASDHDRFLGRLTWRAREKVTVSATYRRHEFAEHRWDNFIHDLYSLSLSGRF